ncbi:MAG: hypothetical protein ACRD3Q_05665, partial [Terriglobales bacterium]
VVSDIDCLSILRKLAAAKIRKGIVVAVAKGQPTIARSAYESRAVDMGVRLEVYTDWASLIGQASQWSALDDSQIAASAARNIRDRAVEMRLYEEAVTEWDAITAESTAAT